MIVLITIFSIIFICAILGLINNITINSSIYRNIETLDVYANNFIKFYKKMKVNRNTRKIDGNLYNILIESRLSLNEIVIGTPRLTNKVYHIKYTDGRYEQMSPGTLNILDSIYYFNDNVDITTLDILYRDTVSQINSLKGLLKKRYIDTKRRIYNPFLCIWDGYCLSFNMILKIINVSESEKSKGVRNFLPFITAIITLITAILEKFY